MLVYGSVSVSELGEEEGNFVCLSAFATTFKEVRVLIKFCKSLSLFKV